MAAGAGSARRWLVGLMALGSCLAVASVAAGQETPPTVSGISGRPAPSGLLGALETEAKLYVDDGWALLRAPFQWGSEDRTKAAGAVVLVGGLMAFDTKLAIESQEQRSSFTNSVSKTTTGFGSGDAWVISGGLIASGLAFHQQRLTLMGREAIEASVFAGLMTSVLKEAAGRVRPRDSNNATTYEPVSSNASFPSGHATQAFAVASVVAARSTGWLVPTLAYSAASVVAFDRVNDRAHFPSDVAAGAIIGTVVGRFIVHRHERTETPSMDISLAPIPHGLGLVAHF